LKRDWIKGRETGDEGTGKGSKSRVAKDKKTGPGGWEEGM
jgi:hypothetical protein